MNPGACRQNDWAQPAVPTAGQSSSSAFFEFNILIPPATPKKLPKTSLIQASPCSSLPILCVLHISERFPPAPSAEGRRGCSRLQQGEEKHRAHFQVESLLLLTKTLQFSAELLSVFKSAPFISLPLVPDSLSRQDNTNETFKNESKRCGKQQGECGKATLLFLFNINIPLKPGTDKI